MLVDVSFTLNEFTCARLTRPHCPSKRGLTELLENTSCAGEKINPQQIVKMIVIQ